MAPAIAREILGPDRVLGLSTNTLTINTRSAPRQAAPRR